MATKTALAVSDALYLKPLLQGLSDPSSPFSLNFDIPAQNALKLAGRIDGTACAFLSPIDYARHGGEFSAVPTVGVSSTQKTDTIQLFVKSDVRNVLTIAVDVRVTSEIILAKIILSEKFRNLSAKESRFQFIPMLPDVERMLKKADAALVVNSPPSSNTQDWFTLDLVEEWNDLTDLPYIHGFWVAREGDMASVEVQHLIDSKQKGVKQLEKIAGDAAIQFNISKETCTSYLSSFSYELGTLEQESISEFLRYSFFHGVIGDIPELNFFDPSPISRGEIH